MNKVVFLDLGGSYNVWAMEQYIRLYICLCGSICMFCCIIKWIKMYSVVFYGK